MYTYSRRLSWSLAPNAFTELVHEKRQSGAKLLDLTVSNPTEVFDNYPHDEIARAYRALSDFAYLPNPLGEESARLAIAEYYATRGISVSPQQLLLTASTSEAYGFLFKLLCNPGDEVLAPVPSYPLFEYLASLESVRIVSYRLRYDGSWFVDLAGVRQRLSPRTRAIIVVNPNNPTGSFLKRDEAQQLFQLAAEHSLPIICDEVFMDYCFGAHPSRLQTLIDSNPVLTFSLNGLSKSAGMPQMKLAWIVITGAKRDCDLARNRLELIADTYLSVGTPVQRVLPNLLRIGAEVQRQIAARIEHNLGVLAATLENTSAHVLHAEGGWSAIVQLPAVSSEETWVARLLTEHDIIVQPGYFFDLEPGSHVVLSLITRPEAFIPAMQKLKQVVYQ